MLYIRMEIRADILKKKFSVIITNTTTKLIINTNTKTNNALSVDIYF